MGNYKDLHHDFVERTLALIEQYEAIKDNFSFDEQYNHTLLINCLLGLTVLPKEKIIAFAPKEKVPVLKAQMGFANSMFDTSLKDTIELIVEMRHCAAHFNIEFISTDEKNYIDRIIFRNDETGSVVADFDANDLLPFIRWFATQLITNYSRFKV